MKLLRSKVALLLPWTVSFLEASLGARGRRRLHPRERVVLVVVVEGSCAVWWWWWWWWVWWWWSQNPREKGCTLMLLLLPMGREGLDMRITRSELSMNDDDDEMERTLCVWGGLIIEKDYDGYGQKKWENKMNKVKRKKESGKWGGCSEQPRPNDEVRLTYDFHTKKDRGKGARENGKS